MATMIVAGFKGAAVALNPKLLPDGVGANAVNQYALRGDLRPINAPLQVATVPAGTKSIYRMGRDTASDTQYWLSWANKVDAVRGFIANDTTERTYYTGDTFPKWTDNAMGLASQPYPSAWRQLGVPAPATAATLSATGGTSTVTQDVFVVYTYVTDKGEESAPSPPQSTALSCLQDATITVSNFAAPPAGNFGIATIRVYQSQAGSTSADFFVVQDIPYTQLTLSYASPTLGNPLVTTDWLPPPSDLKKLTGMWNGMMAGISGRALCFCVPYVPYAWPLAYQQVPPDVTPVALATFGQNLLVLTNGRPIVIAGDDPTTLGQLPIDFDKSCVSDMSAVSVGRGVCWACPDGLAFYGSTEKEGQLAYQFRFGGELVTRNVFTRDDWQALNPTTMVGVRWLDFYIGFYQNATTGLWNAIMVDPMTPGVDPPVVFFFDFGYSAVWKDSITENVYVVDSAGNILKWDAGSPKQATFLSKVFHQTQPIVGFGWCKVVADAYPVQITLLADGNTIGTFTASSADPFRLPGGYYATDFQVQVQTSNPTVEVSFSHDIEELAKT